MYSFWAMNSLRMSFWSVPVSSARGTPAFSAATMYIAQIIAAGVDGHRGADLADGQPRQQDLHVGQAADRHPARPELPGRVRIVMVVAVGVGMSYAIDSPVPPSAMSRGSARSCPRPRRAGEHPHRPQPSPMAGGVDAAGEQRGARLPEVALRVPATQVVRCVEAVDLDPRLGREPRLALGPAHRFRPAPRDLVPRARIGQLGSVPASASSPR